MIEVTSSEIFLRDLGSANGTFVNGVQVRDAVLHPGDQLAFDRNRFLLEAPGMPVRREDAQTPTPPSAPKPAGVAPIITQTMRAVRLDDKTPEETVPANTGSVGNWNPWALIGAAALIAAAIALLILAQ